ncbi:MAG: hypothetical protein FWF22_01525, partial [Treponema sp.]|nr:hypothetical protein [Treponema sp.]
CSFGKNNEKKDSLRYYYFGANNKRHAEHAGIKPSYDADGPFYNLQINYIFNDRYSFLRTQKTQKISVCSQIA